MTTTSALRCPLCPRTRRSDRPLCNTDMRYIGPQTLDRYFLHVKTAKKQPTDSDAAQRLDAVVAQMMTNARTHNQIRNAGYRPFWNAERQQWEHPRDRAREILTRHLHPRTDSFGVHPDFIDRVVAELVPHEKRTRGR